MASPVPSPPPDRPWNRVLFGAWAIGGCLVAVQVVRMVVPESPSRVPFDRAEWIRDPPLGDGRSVRDGMLDDLVANHLRAGATRDEVEVLLGPPGDRETRGWGTRLWWGLGNRRGFFLPHDANLVLDFDEAGRLLPTFRD